MRPFGFVQTSLFPAADLSLAVIPTVDRIMFSNAPDESLLCCGKCMFWKKEMFLLTADAFKIRASSDLLRMCS